MSRAPAIGETWFRKYHSDVFPSDNVIVQGTRVQTPKLYDRLWKKQEPEGFDSILERRRQAVRRTAADRTSERRETHRVVMERNINNKKGKL